MNGDMRLRVMMAATAAVGLIAALSAAQAEGALGRVSLPAGPAFAAATLDVPCADMNRDASGFGAAHDTCGPTQDSLFPAALAASAPYVALTAQIDSGSLDMKLANDFNLSLGTTALTPQPLASGTMAGLAAFDNSAQALANRPLAQASFAGVSWNVASWASLSLIAAQSTANDPFDSQMLGSLALAKSSRSAVAGASARLGDNWVTTVSYGQGISQLNLRSGSLLDDDDLLRSHSYGLSIARRGLFGSGDAVDLDITRKLAAYTSGFDLTGNGGFDSIGKGNLFTVPETDFEVGYVTTFLDGALALQANAAYQTNVNGQNGQNGLTVLSRAKFNF
jgi:hypothetical protein